jgi:alpha-ketoglutarate-dependent taurine dioxygenase
VKNWTLRLHPCHIRFQMFSSLIPAPRGTGRTLFASSRLLLKALLKRYTLSQLAAVTWECKTDAFNETLLKDMALFVPHPENNALCIRYHEPWPETHTKFDATEVRLHNDPDGLFNDLNSLLYDSRICNYLQFGHGDIIVSDNILMMHTREAYAPGSPRRFWRIHVN